MTAQSELLRLIESVDPNDAAKLDEIDALFWVWYRGDEYAIRPSKNVAGELLKTNNYKCGHCGYEGSCYGNGYSVPWCKQCERNDKLSLSAHEAAIKGA